MAEQKKITVENVFDAVRSAHQIKKWPGEYRIYSKDTIVFVYCDQAGLPSCYVYETSGKQYPFSDFESKMLSVFIEERYAKMCQIARKNIEYESRMK